MKHTILLLLSGKWKFRFYLNLFTKTNNKYFRKFLVGRIYKTSSCIFSESSNISNSVKFPHPTGIVIGAGVTIAENSIVYQNVTIGLSKKDSFINNEEPTNYYPYIEENVTIYANSLVIGGIHVGKNAIIGGSTLVNKDVPENAIVGGNPCKIIKIQEGL